MACCYREATTFTVPAVTVAYKWADDDKWRQTPCIWARLHGVSGLRQILVGDKFITTSKSSRRHPSTDPLADLDHAAEMVGFVVLHHLVGNAFGFVAAADLFECKDVMHVGCLVDGENLEPQAAFVGVGKDDRGHGRHLLRE